MTDLVTTGRAEVTAWTDQIDLVKRMYADGASNDEFAVFIALARKYDLDPLNREVWCVKRRPQDPAVITISRDGYLKIAHREDDFDGVQSDVVREHDTFRKNADGTVEHQYGYKDGKRGPIVGAYAVVYRRGFRVPFYFFAPWVEYGKPNIQTDERGNIKNGYSPWVKFPSAMVQKVAEANALKRAFPVSGAAPEYATDAEDAAAEPELPVTAPPEPVGEDGQTLLGEVA